MNLMRLDTKTHGERILSAKFGETYYREISDLCRVIADKHRGTIETLEELEAEREKVAELQEEIRTLREQRDKANADAQSTCGGPTNAP